MPFITLQPFYREPASDGRFADLPFRQFTDLEWKKGARNRWDGTHLLVMQVINGYDGRVGYNFKIKSDFLYKVRLLFLAVWARYNW